MIWKNAAKIGTAFTQNSNLLDVATGSEDFQGLPGMRLHRLQGEFRGYGAVSASGNWRVVFQLDADETTDVDLIGYY